MEHCINIEGTKNYENIEQSIFNDVGELPPYRSECCIYRVHERLSKVKPEAYKPMVVSIGPYHLQNPMLQANKKHKVWYLHSLLERKKESMERYIVELKKLEDSVRKCYAEPIDINSDKFVEMMLLDACFIVEFFREKTPNPILQVGWMEDQIFHDLMLLENQLPFFLLSKLYDMTKEGPQEEPLMNMAKSVLSRSRRIPKPCLNSEYFYKDDDPQGIKHLLHLVHVLCLPSPETRISERNTRDESTQNRMRSVVELREAGVKVDAFYTENANFFNINFEDSLMKVPCFSVDDTTDTFFRNLIAFEQHSLDVNPKCFTDFVHFMAQLIRSEQDVERLRICGIIENYLGNDQDVSNLFNKLSDAVVVSPPEYYYYFEVHKRVNRHCKKPQTKMLATLRHEYFTGPLVAITVLQSVVILVLTLAQTIVSVAGLSDKAPS